MHHLKKCKNEQLQQGVTTGGHVRMEATMASLLGRYQVRIWYLSRLAPLSGCFWVKVSMSGLWS